MAEARIDVVVREDGSRVVKRNLEDVGESGKKAAFGVDFLKKALVGALAGTAVVAMLRSLTSAAFEFTDQITEVSTLVNTATFDMDALTEAAKRQAVQFGSMPTLQAKALYQIVSAGASDATTATERLNAANQLAVGGVTDVLTAADGLTSVMNAYGAAAGSATDVTDAMFTAVKAGKTTIAELSSSLGMVAPLASVVGVSFDELTASVAALTKGGMATSVAVTGVRAILAAVAKPSEEAKDLAKELGIDFSAAGLKAKGFAGFLEELTSKTGGSTEKLALLFGGVEALVPMLALSGQAGVDFYNILDQMENKTGATAEAFEKMAQSPGFQLNRVFAAIKVEAIELGTGIAKALVPVMKLAADNMGNVVDVAKLLVVVTGAYMALIAGNKVLGFAGELIRLEKALGAASMMQAVLGVATKFTTGAFNGLTLAIAANPLGALLVAVTAVIAAFILFGDQIKITSDGAVSLKDGFFAALSLIGDMFAGVGQFISSTWGTMVDFLKSNFSAFGDWTGDILTDILNMAKAVINGQIGLWVFAFNAVKLVWNNFPGAMNLLFVSVVNLGITAVEALVNSWQIGLRLIAGLVGKLSPELASNLNSALDKVTVRIPRAKASAAGAQFGSDLSAAAGSAFSTDFVGDATDAIIKRARERGSASGAGGVVTGATDPAAAAVEDATSDAGKGGKDTGQTRVQYLQQLREETQAATDVAKGLNYEWRQVDSDMAGIAQNLKENNWAPLTEGETLALREKIKAMYDEQALQQMRDGILQAAREPQLEYERHLKAAKQLLDAGKLSLDEWTDSVQDARIAFLQTKDDLASGLELGRLQVLKEVADDASRVASAYRAQFMAANDGLLQLQANAAALKQLMIDDPINSGNYGRELQNIAMAAAALRVEMGQGSLTDVMVTSLGGLVGGFRGVAAELTTIWGDFNTKLVDGFADSIGRAIVYGDDLKESLRDLARSALSELISALVKVGIQWLINKAMALAGIGATTAATVASHATTTASAIGATAAATTASVAAGALTAAAWAPAAAAVSLASFGANAAPAAAGISLTAALAIAVLAAGAGFLLAKAFRTGGPVSGPGTGTSDSIPAWLSDGEFVVNANATSQNRQLLELINSGTDVGAMMVARASNDNRFARGGGVGRAVTVMRPTSQAMPSGDVNVTIEDHSQKGMDFEVEQVGPNQVRIIAREEARRTLRDEGPALVAGEISNPNSKTSRALGQHTKTERKR
jgi:TP901 family phage tail tape measure protein